MKIIANTFEAHKELLESKFYWCINPLNCNEILIAENEIQLTGAERQIAYANALVWRYLNHIIDQIKENPNNQDEMTTDAIIVHIESIIRSTNEECKTANAVIERYKQTAQRRKE
ncbi:hypothetical protein RWV98_05970 [Agathobaculum sp. NTUH-O15-33]|uniref:hypothetical protein n=1 Tax=Agathobaculum sp. NTUH-O15-33 TaxID=3079302 RepID=UPI002958D1D3|nr:hypothetical protein [Agathobaculum sp. NTUH-O15-33]WNX85815.1 hypothetical protein RWV98_05970 [Agathobaculum sp. NTUH-O15-33]